MVLVHYDKVWASFKEYLEIINGEAYRCKDIIQNLRDFSSSSSDDYEPVDIDQIILAKGVLTMSMKEKENQKTLKNIEEKETKEQPSTASPIVEEITIEELAVDGICGIY